MGAARLEVFPPSKEEIARREKVFDVARHRRHLEEVTGNVLTLTVAMLWALVSASSFAEGDIVTDATAVAIQQGRHIRKSIRATKAELRQAEEVFRTAVSDAVAELGISLQLAPK